MQRPDTVALDPFAPALEGLDGACQIWETTGDEAPLRRWLAAEVDYDGSPRRLPVGAWGPCLDLLARASRARPGWSKWSRTRVGGLFQWLVHGSRPDGSPVFGPSAKDPTRIRVLADASALATEEEAGLVSVVSGWFPAALPPRRKPASPPSAALVDNDWVLAMLRPGWEARSAWIAVDHRDPSAPGLVELSADGRPWLLGPWLADGLPSPDVPPRPGRWESDAEAGAEALEWSFRAGTVKVTRTAVVLRDQGLALLAQQEDGPSASPTATLRLPLAEGVSAAANRDLRSLALSRANARARLVPLSLPALPYPTDRGSFAVEGREAVLRAPSNHPRRWLPLVLAWGEAPTSWRTLTVTEKSRPCSPAAAFAARLSWGVGREGLLVYRSLGRPALRAVLGHQTRARFLVARFTADGDVEPLLTLD